MKHEQDTSPILKENQDGSLNYSGYSSASVIGNSRAYLADCMVMLKQTPDNYYDLSIVDPPYGIGEDGRNNHTRSNLAKAADYRSSSRYDNAIPDANYFDELRRVSKNQIIWGGNYFIRHLDSTSCFIIWDKNNGDNDFADCELAWTSFDTACRKFKWTWAGMLQEDMKNKEKRIHPNHKPIPLYKFCFKNYANLGDKILDTHLGSGSSRIAAYDMGFDFTGFEIDESYFIAQEERFAKHKSQLKLFDLGNTRATAYQQGCDKGDTSTANYQGDLLL